MKNINVSTMSRSTATHPDIEQASPAANQALVEGGNDHHFNTSAVSADCSHLNTQQAQASRLRRGDQTNIARSL